MWIPRINDIPVAHRQSSHVCRILYFFNYLQGHCSSLSWPQCNANQAWKLLHNFLRQVPDMFGHAWPQNGVYETVTRQILLSRLGKTAVSTTEKSAIGFSVWYFSILGRRSPKNPLNLNHFPPPKHIDNRLKIIPFHLQEKLSKDH